MCLLQVPQGAHVRISHYASHSSAIYFTDPDAFQAERWQGGFEASLTRRAHFLFGARTHKRLGDQFALLESHIILVELARTTRPVPVWSTLPTAEPRATYRPAGGGSLLALCGSQSGDLVADSPNVVGRRGERHHIELAV